MTSYLQPIGASRIGGMIHVIRGRREMGFHIKEEARRYRIRNGA